MKKIIIFLVFVVFATTGLTAQERDQDRIQDQDRTNLTMVNGEMLQLRDRAQVRLKEQVTLNDGTIITPKGLYTTKDGKQLKLKKGECLDNDGIKYRNEYQYRYKIQQENKGLDQVQIQNRNQNRIHYVLMDGDMLQVRNQLQERLQTSMTLNNGTVVNPDGTYQARDRKQLRLKDGECLNMDGKLYQNQIQHRKMLIQKNKKMLNKKMPIKKPNTPKKMVKKNIGKKV
jgi:adhesin HecA-like repeat protein